MTVARRGSTVKVIELARTVPGIPLHMGVGWEFPWEWEHKYAKMAMGMGRVHVTMGMATFSRVPKFPSVDSML